MLQNITNKKKSFFERRWRIANDYDFACILNNWLKFSDYQVNLGLNCALLYTTEQPVIIYYVK